MTKRLLTPAEIKKADELYNMYKGKKREFVERYGKDAEKIMRGRAIKNVKTKTENMHKDKIKEMVKSALQNPSAINAKEYLSKRDKNLKEAFNPTDAITMDVPLFIRMMEYAREDAKSDMDLHDVAEKSIQASVGGKTLTMSDYTNLVGEKINEDDWMQSDDESDMAHSQLISIKSNTDKLMNVIDPNEQLDAWVQSKLTKAQDYLQSVYDYLNGEETIETNTKMNEAKENSGLIVTGKTQIDNYKIREWLKNTDFYGEWNAEGEYWFFPENEETYDELESSIEQEFSKQGINARFEGIFNESLPITKQVKETELDEKHLTPAEKEKKEDIVKAMKKTFKGPKPALYAIATEKAKKVAEESLVEKIMSKLKGKSELNEYDEIELDDDDDLDYGGDDSYKNQMKQYYNSNNFPNEIARNKQLKAHDTSVEEFIADNGNTLSIDKLVNWLGY